MTFGKRLRFLRKKRNMTQKDLADRFNLGESTIGMYERDEREPSFEFVRQLADFFNVTTDYLLGRTDNPSPPESDIPEELNTLAKINQLIKEYGIEQMGFFDIEKWKSLSEEEIEEIIKHFEWVVHKAKEKNKDSSEE
ncbi:helix-turn-helix domain-containing protein [Parageobacillus thermoglucosidasius]|uniref:helix-turn-helix domain-containing protein n=1 Tax=Parageobacillus thermoglucosidasius TaxID=1426 RepID=UPI000E153EFD|nr:helix-turn-helix transcriptional regulator [Parageobacillus thermoglucosidasius]MED4904080.1 helix-turn-helix transcriptional regulator [Parageobacillus thermoglucosidasius]MED4915630.1 helix-turn-helix transcriptional regulator [Parageobacillus thermoglucosidasius]MED4945105.1 helix-turn-helix transcriptional regulator [Parageobacillus thermoglucosidasius]MED4983698.1 helix-turn-helix transcriptional regulator [Parageobacillus thermoglucosidasius]RDE19356.1 XRE family transcriptional regul